MTKRVFNDKLVETSTIEKDAFTLQTVTDELREIIDLLKEDLNVTRSELDKTKLDIFKLYDHFVRLKFVVVGCIIAIIVLLVILLGGF